MELCVRKFKSSDAGYFKESSADDRDKMKELVRSFNDGGQDNFNKLMWLLYRIQLVST